MAGIPYSDELYHHGIKGQKWGLRRYQNDDGSLTPAGRARYGNDLGEYATKKQGVVRRLATGDWALGNKRIGEKYLEGGSQKRADKLRAEGKAKEAENYQKQADMYRKRNIDREKYNSHASTGKLIAQNFLMGPIGADSYRIARQRGETRGQAAVAGILANVVPYVGGIATIGVEAYKTKKNYYG